MRGLTAVYEAQFPLLACRHELGPLGAVDVRVPLSAQVAILTTWADVPDKGASVQADSRFAGELNAFVVAQAERQWMHRPGDEPPIFRGLFGPLSRSVELAHCARDLAASRRRAYAADFLGRVREVRFLRDIEIVDLQWSS